MSWSFDTNTMTTVDGHDLIQRTDLEEAAQRLWNAGVRNRRLLADVLTTLSGLSIAEVRFTLELCLPTAVTFFGNPPTRLTPASSRSLSTD